ncbi:MULTISPECIES: competence type IV pilus major pilin ComGC [unclassified Lactobacillus]|uniref:competence type IV pilus major pilin ComGC n=1 Tax=unclassified Lactobacillus TaxID=2620435 RepID=UPI000EFBA6F7|nr:MULTISPECIES: competence type IV pilus major pilin ComGC [unclassified Lactobacillus]RMC40833.1 prepilin-type N-terminal cleavage/methylation domain-containing protein [Lactobacillus sp. ESL0237]RMC44588.1 prepilin-type N-terminal cleavage/methylation domain-containing protein [Lactobacillus sp. ESL0234]RMC45895.1 prepilin-type N-terminal cleavage/methylation domain-containing protein [Lactobacillus sp. ESL0236]RMC46232.1 prepilin-type N-terminal cleavage/methylation domain-containing protei
MKNRIKKHLLAIITKAEKPQGFTLIEMVVVIAIIVMLLIIIAPNLTKQKESASERTDDAFKTTLQTQVNLYEDDKDRNGKEINFKNMFDDGYLTKKQLDKAKNYVVSNGVVEKNSN